MSAPFGLAAIGGGLLLMWLVLAGYHLPWESGTGKGQTNATGRGTSGPASSGSGGYLSGLPRQQGVSGNTPANLSPQIQTYFPLPAL